tara:strand:+ start:6638 stop:6796 length:159 start_codon:yes stop_codon:yes gene_type:complete
LEWTNIKHKLPIAQQPFGVIGDLVELAFFYYLYVKPKILGFKSPQPRQAPRR